MTVKAIKISICNPSEVIKPAAFLCAFRFKDSLAPPLLWVVAEGKENDGNI